MYKLHVPTSYWLGQPLNFKNMVISTQNQLFTGIFFKVLNYWLIYIANSPSTLAKLLFKIEYVLHWFKVNAKIIENQRTLVAFTCIFVPCPCHHNRSKNHFMEWSVVMVDGSLNLLTIINHRHSWSNHLKARFGGGEKERIFTLFTVIYPKLSRGESKYPESC